MNFNKVILGGHLTADPELKDGTNSKYADFSIAVNRAYKENKSVHFINCRAYGAKAEVIDKYFKKGKPILIEGRLDQSRWEDGEGKNRSMLRVVVEEFQFVDSQKKTEAPEAVGTAFGDISSEGYDIL